MAGITKSALRGQFRSVGVPSGRAGRTVIGLLQKLPQEASVFCYLSLPDEPDTTPITDYCLQNGHLLCIPRCLDNGGMQACRFTDKKELTKNRFGIWEPSESAEVIQNPDVIIVPALAFDRQGFRLGRGGGYYDRYLAGRSALTIGLCHQAAFVDLLPRDPWDIPVALVVSEQGIWDVKEQLWR